MVTKPKLTDDEWLEKFEHGEIEFDPSRSQSLIDLIDVRALELLRREASDAVMNSVRLARQNGSTWSTIALELGVDERTALTTYRDVIGAAAEAEGHRLESAAEVASGISFMVRHLAAVEQRLRDTIDRAVAEDADLAVFIYNYLARSDDDARMRWNLLD